MKVSIIIPTYNEEDYLPNLLKSIKSQKFEDYEIIVADANSSDETVKIAKDYGCKVVKGGMPGVGRNNGAKYAKSEILLFLDSDLQLTENYLEELIDEFVARKIDIGITQISPLSEKRKDIILHELANWFMIAFEKIKPHGAGCYGIVAKKSLHDKCSGFDENLTFGEDTDYIERLAKNNKFRVLRKPIINVSTRRLEEEGLGKLIKQYGISTFNDFRGKRTSAEDLGYGFGHGPKDSIEKEDLSFLNNQNDKIVDNKISIDKISNKDTIKNNEKTPKKDTIKNNEKTSNKKTIKNNKKRIFYAVCGEGMGHAVRSSVILNELTNKENQNKYDIYIFSSERGYDYLKNKFENVFEIGGFNTVYEDNIVNNRKTFLNAVKSSPDNLKENYETLYKKAREIKPNIIISDFENYSSILSTIINVPLISIDNMHIITQSKIEYPPNQRQNMLKAASVIKTYILKSKRYIITSFFYPKLKNPKKAVIYPPIIRDEIINLKTSKKDYIFVYQTSSSNIELIKLLKSSDEKFIVYGFDKDLKDDNLTFRKFNEDQIYEDMSNAKAVLANGGFTLITEAIYLKKPIYSIPAIGNFEQYLNGFYVEKLGLGEAHTKIDSERLNNFLNNLNKYQNNLDKIKNTDNQGIINELKESIEKFSKKS